MAEGPVPALFPLLLPVDNGKLHCCPAPWQPMAVGGGLGGGLGPAPCLRA